MFYETQKNLGIRYRSAEDDVIQDFYVPVLSDSVQYDRAVGYFSSTVLLAYIDGLERFVENGGHMRLLISPFLSLEDQLAVIKSFNPDEIIQNNLDDLFSSYRLDGDESNISAQILYKLIESGIIDIKVVVPKDERGLFHEKVALFYDKLGTIIATEGSNNETGSAMIQNFEAFSVYRQWDQGEVKFLDSIKSDFDKTWEGRLTQYRTLNLKEAVSEQVLVEYKTEESLSALYQRLRKNSEVRTEVKDSDMSESLGFTPFDYQIEAAEKWIEVKKGIIAFATGTGKTKTAVYAIDQLIKNYDQKVFVVVVPDKTLVNQWADNDLSKSWEDIVKCFSENVHWRDELRRKIKEANIGELSRPLFIVTTIDTFKMNLRRDDIQKQLQKLGNNYVLIADECHRLGTDSGLQSLPLQVERRLGLSATPEIYMSPEKTERLFDYFGGIIASYPLREAIKNNKLVPYEYHPVVVHLTDEERETYRKLTHNLIQMIGNIDEKSWDGLTPQAEMLLFKRARIVYGAREKLSQLKGLLHKIQDHRNMLVYCGATSLINDNADIETENDAANIRQIDTVMEELQTSGLRAVRYTAEENGMERKDRIRWFEDNSADVIVAIKALDEGVDIPQIDTGIILASSGNPREFVQRRGRMLRKYSNKTKATIYDMVVLDDEFEGLNRSEIKRVYEFSKDALNSEDLLRQYSEEIKLYVEGEQEDE